MYVYVCVYSNNIVLYIYIYIYIPRLIVYDVQDGVCLLTFA